MRYILNNFRWLNSDAYEVIVLKKKFYILLVSCLLASIAGAAHPFLLVQESDFPALRSLTASNPWTVMKSRAIRDAEPGYIVFDPAEDYGAKCVDGKDIISSTSLAYILDDVNKTTHKNNLVTQMNTRHI
jgi:hypothetical protein